MLDLTHISLFTGIGGFDLAAEWAGFRTIAMCEIDPFCQEVLKARFGTVADTEVDGLQGVRTSGVSIPSPRREEAESQGVHSGPVLISDIREFDGTRFRGATLLTGGFPCQPFSHAGKRRGKEDDRHLWPEMLRVIREARPAWVLAENVAGLISMELHQVLADLEGAGYEVDSYVVPACAVNAPHRRDRVWIVAHAVGPGAGCGCGTTPDEGRRIRQSGRKGIRQKDGAVGAGGTPATDSDAPDAARQLLNGAGKTRPAGGREHSNGGWDIPWIEVATGLCGMDARISDWIHLYLVRGIDNVPSLKALSDKDLRVLWTTLLTEEVQREIGRLWKIPEPEILWQILCELKIRTDEPSNFSSPSEEILGEMLRDVWHEAELRCPPSGRKHPEQHLRQHANALPFVPYEVASDIEKICQGIGYLRKTISSGRVARLKVLGNAIVPQVAAEIIKSIAEIERGIT